MKAPKKGAEADKARDKSIYEAPGPCKAGSDERAAEDESEIPCSQEQPNEKSEQEEKPESPAAIAEKQHVKDRQVLAGPKTKPTEPHAPQEE